jgi:hypothetical protein
MRRGLIKEHIHGPTHELEPCRLRNLCAVLNDRHAYAFPTRAGDRDFSGSQITVNEVPALGELVSVTLAIVPDSGSTTFTLFLPRVNLPPAPVPVCTEGVTTNHHTALAPQTLHGQLDFYTVTSLRGTAN